jgi:hypothetical protein
MGRTRWSPFSIVWQISQGKLQHSITDLFIAPIEIAVIYLLLIIFLAGVLRRWRQSWLLGLSFALNPVWWSGESDDFEELFYGKPSFLDFSRYQKTVDVSPLYGVLALVSLVLLFVCLHGPLDE